MFNRIVIAICAAFVLMPAAASAKTDKIEQIGKALAIAEPIFAGGVSLTKNDWTGIGELALAGALTVGTAYGLKHVVHEERPDHSDNQSFPSSTSSVAFISANYLWDRYGWQWGLPAYAVAGFVGYSRVQANRHHWWDVAGSAAIAFAYSRLIVTRFHRYNIDASVYAAPNAVYVGMNYKF